MSSSLPTLYHERDTHGLCVVWLWMKHAESALEGADCPHCWVASTAYASLPGGDSLWGGRFQQRSSRYLPRFRRGGAVAVLVVISGGENEDGRAPIFFLFYQIQRPLSEIGSPPLGFSPRSKGSTLRVSFSEEGALKKNVKITLITKSAITCRLIDMF